MRKSGGVTLIEIVITMGILAMLVAILHVAFTAALRSWRKADVVSQSAAIGRMALEQMTREIGSARIDGNSPRFYCIGYDGPSGMRPDSKADEFYFIAPLNQSDTEQDSSLCEAGYWLDDQGTAAVSDDILMRYYLTDGRKTGDPAGFDFDFSTGAASASQQFLTNITDVQFTYYDSAGNEHASWDSRARGGPPSRLKITLTVEVGAGSAATNPEYFSGQYSAGIAFPNGV